MSEKVCSPLLLPVSNRAQMAANWARVMGASGVEGRACIAALHDVQSGHGGDGGVGPVTVRHVGVGVAGEQVGVTDGVLQQAEEDGVLRLRG